MCDKKCCLCNKSMGDDAVYIKLHNICRCCLDSGKDVENIINGVSMPLTQWETTHIKKCKDCNATYVALWYASIHCGPCAAKRTAIRERKQQEILQKRLQAEHECAMLLQKRIEEKERRKAARIATQWEIFKALSPEELQRMKEQRIKEYFQGCVPFDVATACRIMAERYPIRSDLDTYGVLYDFFVIGYPLSVLANKYERSTSGLDMVIKKLCVRILCSYKHYWLFRPTIRLSKTEMTQIIQQQINDIIESQSRTE